MGEGGVVFDRILRSVVDAPWWKTLLVGIVLAVVSFAGPRALTLLGAEENVLLNVLAALWWVPLLVLGFLSAVGFVRQAKGRLARSKPHSPQHRRSADSRSK